MLLSHLRRPELYLSGKPDAPPMPIVLELFAHHLALSDRWLSFADMLASSDALLEPMTRELLDSPGRVADTIGLRMEPTPPDGGRRGPG